MSKNLNVPLRSVPTNLAAALKLDEAAETAKIAERLRELLRSHLHQSRAGRGYFRRHRQRGLCGIGRACGRARACVWPAIARARLRI